MSAGPSHLGHHVLVHLLDVLELVEPPGDGGLVRHDGHRDACGVEPGDGLHGPVQEHDVLDRPHVAAVDVDRPVTVEQNPPARHDSTPIAPT
jgi:hypothetical protein